MSNTSRINPARKSGPRARPEAERSRAETSPLEAHIGYWLRFVSNHVSHAFKMKLAQHGVTVAEWVVMRALFDNHGLRPSEISNSIGLTRGAVSKLLERLANKGLLVRRGDVDDHRAQVVALTASGRRLVPKLAALADHNDAEMFGHLDAKDQKSLLSLLRGIVAFHGLEGVPID
jgi:DNA-binding MarR family transcriptional regulator